MCVIRIKQEKVRRENLVHERIVIYWLLDVYKIKFLLFSFFISGLRSIGYNIKLKRLLCIKFWKSINFQLREIFVSRVQFLTSKKKCLKWTFIYRIKLKLKKVMSQLQFIRSFIFFVSLRFWWLIVYYYCNTPDFVLLNYTQV